MKDRKEKILETKFNFKRIPRKQGLYALIFIAVLVICFFTLQRSKHYEEPTLVGSWKSSETDIILEFTQDGLVKFNDSLDKGTYRIISPTEMAYTIDDKTFIMTYQLEGRSLEWGDDPDNLERFTRK